MTLEGRIPRPRPAPARASEEVSALDKRIIEHLQADGRRPFTQIASDLGVSEAAVRARTNRLIERGILQVVGVTDPLLLFIGCYQIPMYLTPILLGRFYRGIVDTKAAET